MLSTGLSSKDVSVIGQATLIAFAAELVRADRPRQAAKPSAESATLAAVVDGLQEDSTAAIHAPLPKLPPGPWRSLGGYMDYSHWEDRERFLALDAAIATLRPDGSSRPSAFAPGRSQGNTSRRISHACRDAA